MQADYIEAHEFCSNNREQLLQGETCGCFFCLAVFSPLEIERWLQEGTGTAVCPCCGIDSVIGEGAGFPVTREFLEKMKGHWFGKGGKNIKF